VQTGHSSVSRSREAFFDTALDSPPVKLVSYNRRRTAAQVHTVA
jgi:hypothetical protein